MSLDATIIRSLAEQYHTPLYVFVESTVRARCRDLKQAITYPLTTIRYACKALTLQSILKIIRDEGLWIDASSLNEAKRALMAGYAPHQIRYTGESASIPVFSELLEMKIPMNCSSLDQMRLLGELAPGLSLSVRINPGEGHGANNKVNTGGPSSKHGIYIDQIETIHALSREFNLRIEGIHTHIGSGTDLAHWLRIKDLTLALAKTFDDLDFINLGGGLPVVYNPVTDRPMPLAEWGSRLTESFQSFSQEYGKQIQLQIEPGRYVVAECGYLLSEVQNIKETPLYTFALLNTGFNHNPRPAMYGSYHPLEVVTKDGRASAEERDYVIAGYLCESGDVFTRDEHGALIPRSLPILQLGDIVVMGLVGAYSHAMKSDYNSMNMPASVLLEEDGSVRVIERRGTLEDVMRREIDVF